MSVGKIGRVGKYLTTRDKLVKGIWPWNHGVRSRLPEYYKRQYIELFQRKPIPVHYRPDPAKFTIDEFGERQPVQDIPLPLTFPDECHDGLWGGEGIVEGLRRKKDHEYKPAVPKIWKPKLVKRVFYSEILNRWMSITVTPRTLDLIDEAFGFDYYILKNHAVDLHSRLGMRLKREMLLKLVRKSMYPDDVERNEKVYNKYKEFIIPEEEADWTGLTLVEAELKQEAIEEKEQQASIKPYKFVYMEQLLDDMKHGRLDDTELGPGPGWLSKLNPFVTKPKEESK